MLSRLPRLGQSIRVRHPDITLIPLTRLYSGTRVRQSKVSPISNGQSSTNANQSIATKQRLYMLDPYSPGSPFFLPNGTRIINKLIKFMKLQQSKQDFTEVITPLIFKKDLWEISGHWQNYKEDMFKVESNDKSKLLEEELNDIYGLKPMNCPGHCLVFGRFVRSYRELPIRLSDWSSLHRNEASGALTGLTRVRRFHQDDGHIFCTRGQIGEEIAKTLKLIKICYGVFGFDKYRMVLSTRPSEKYMGKLEEWDLAEKQLAGVLDDTVGSKKWSINEGDGAFYGPKIDITLTDKFGKEHQVATIQLDFQLPQRFDLKYQSENDTLETPIMIHRAILGSVERFMAMLIDHYEGKWPFWLSPRQAVVIPINSSHVEYAEKLQLKLSNESHDFENATKLSDEHFYVDVDSRNETVGFRTKDAIAKGYNYIIMVGDKEMESNKLAIRSRNDRKVEQLTAEEVLAKFRQLEETYQ
ncbi:DEKNAAC100359 [Brettanomyces naardenensis]|uniref:threonine--tRNA ligase n=1 Tax=Brettanomyces naardenensis TaxID=13370 RepID=A0A448YEN7_BRENA|nr:DEKNAAC100359 [Brettanomyces naardenensis]